MPDRRAGLTQSQALTAALEAVEMAVTHVRITDALGQAEIALRTALNDTGDGE